MASAICCIVPIVLSVLLLSCEAQQTIYPIEYIYQLGDSLSDTGNLIHQATAGETVAAAHLPYGESFLDRPTGRWSNGLLIIDFIVAGSTALDYSFFSTRGIYNPVTNNSLGDQLNWFKSHLNTNFHSSAECSKMFTRALVFLGEIGGNDINYSLQEGKSIKELYSYLPYMIEVISNAVREVIHLGAVNIVVPGNFPMGCFPIFLTKFSCGDPTTYDDMGCLRDLNELVLAQNNFLQKALALLRLEFPHVVLIYADYYTTFQTILRRAPDFGFDEQSLLQACCGIGGVHNYDEERACGRQGVPVCHNPVQYISWDGIHLTQDAYRHITTILIHDILPRTMASPMTMEA